MKGRPTVLRILRLAANRIALGLDQYTCHAIRLAGPCGDRDPTLVWYLDTTRRHSGERGHLFHAFDPAGRDLPRDERQQYRLMWLCWLIGMLEAGEEP